MKIQSFYQENSCNTKLGQKTCIVKRDMTKLCTSERFNVLCSGKLIMIMSISRFLQCYNILSVNKAGKKKFFPPKSLDPLENYINVNLGGGVGEGNSLNTLETVKPVPLAFRSIQSHFIRDVYLVSLPCPSLQTLCKTQMGAFLISKLLVNPLYK